MSNPKSIRARWTRITDQSIGEAQADIDVLLNALEQSKTERNVLADIIKDRRDVRPYGNASCPNEFEECPYRHDGDFACPYSMAAIPAQCWIDWSKEKASGQLGATRKCENKAQSAKQPESR